MSFGKDKNKQQGPGLAQLKMNNASRDLRRGERAGAADGHVEVLFKHEVEFLSGVIVVAGRGGFFRGRLPVFALPLFDLIKNLNVRRDH